MSCGQVVFQDEETGARLVRVPAFSRLVWWLDVKAMTPQKTRELVARWNASSERKRYLGDSEPPPVC